MPPVAAWLGGSAFAGWVALNFGVAGAVTAGFIIKTAIVLGAAAYSRRQQRKARAAALDSIRDRTFMVRTGTEDRPIVDGRTRLSGPFRPLGTHGPDGERLSFTVSLAGPLDAVESVWFGDEAIGTLDGSGWTTTGTYYRSSVPPALFYEAVSGSSTVTLPHLATSITSIWIGSSFDLDGGTEFHLGDPVTDTLAYSSATVGGVTVLTFNAAQVGRTVVVNYSYASGQSFARALPFLGQAGQAADPYLIQEFPTIWTSDHRSDSASYLSCTLIYDTDIYPTGIPNVSAIVRGKRVYDPRTTTTVWSQNPALIARDYLISEIGCESTEIDDTSVIAAANACDEPVPIAAAVTISTLQKATVCLVETSSAHGFAVGDTVSFAVTGMTELNGQLWTVTQINSTTVFEINTNSLGYGVFLGGNVWKAQARYTFDGALSSATNRLDNLEQILMSMAGTAVYSAGKWVIRAGVYYAATLALDEDDLANDQIVVQAFANRRDLMNGVRGTYIDPTTYKENDFPAYLSPTYLAEDNDDEAYQDISLSMVTDVNRAQRLAKLMLFRSRQALTFSASFNLGAYEVTQGDVVEVTMGRYGWAAKEFLCVDREYDPAGGVKLTFREEAEAVYDWDFNEATTPDPAPNTNLPSVRYVEPPELTFASGTQFADYLADGTAAPFLRVYWQEYGAEVVSVEILWRRASEITWATAIVAAQDDAYDIYGVSGSETYIVQARAINGIGVKSAWSAYSVEVDPNAPANGGNVTLGVGVNLIENATMQNTANGWRVWLVDAGYPIADARATTVVSGRTYTYARSYTGLAEENRRPIPYGGVYLEQAVGGVEDSGAAFFYNTKSIPVQFGARIELQARVGGYQYAGAGLFVAYYSASDTFISVAPLSGVTTLYPSEAYTGVGSVEADDFFGYQTLESFKHLYGFAEVPEGAARARLILRLNRSAVSSTMSLAMAMPYLGIAHEGQTQPSAWGPGPAGGLIEGIDAVDTDTIAPEAATEVLTAFDASTTLPSESPWYVDRDISYTNDTGYDVEAVCIGTGHAMGVMGVFASNSFLLRNSVYHTAFVTIGDGIGNYQAVYYKDTAELNWGFSTTARFAVPAGASRTFRLRLVYNTGLTSGTVFDRAFRVEIIKR